MKRSVSKSSLHAVLAIGLGVSAVPAQDAFENDDSPVLAQRWEGALVQPHTLHGDADEDWIAFRDQRPCYYEADWYLYADDPDGPLFQPVVEIYGYDRLTDPAVPPITVYSACGMPAANFDQALIFTERAEGLWRIRNCPDVVPPADQELAYIFEQQRPSINCSPLGRIEGLVVEANTGAVVSGGLFIGSDQNVTTFANPDDGTYTMAVLTAAENSGEHNVTVWVISDQWTGPPVSATVTGGELVSGVNLQVTHLDELFQDGFEFTFSRLIR